MLTRRTLFTTMAAFSVAADAATPEPNSARVVHEYKHRLNAPADRVFPLLCPVEEYRWLSVWSCRMVYSDSGVAEDNCVFVTDFPDAGEEIWTTVCYEPNRRIEYVMVGGGSHVSRIGVRLVEENGRTTLHWTRTFTGLTEEGNAYVESRTAEWSRELGDYIHESLAHYLKTGEMFFPGAPEVG